MSKFGNVLHSLGVKKGDRVVLYLPMIPEAAYAMLACARIGAIHSVVFAGFSADALRSPRRGLGREAGHHRRRGAARRPPHAAEGQRRQGARRACRASASSWCAAPAATCPGTPTATSGCTRRWSASPTTASRWRWAPRTRSSSSTPPARTGQPKGVVHTTGGYLVYAAMTHEYVFDYHDGDIYWCTADVGWVTGHSYIVYGPLANGATTLMFEGVPTWPDASRFWQVCEKHKVNIFYTAPTAIRALMGQGREWVDQLRPLQPAHPRHASASRSTRRPGTGTTRWSGTTAARSSTPGGRPRPAAS